MADPLSNQDARSRVMPRSLSKKVREELAALRPSQETRRQLGLQIEAPIFGHDPLVGKEHPGIGIVPVLLDWHPGIGDGPSDGRVAVVDYDGDSGAVAEPVSWNDKDWRFEYPKGKELCYGPEIEKDGNGSLQFDQLSVWATIQGVLALYEDRNALGRPVPWGFAGNRLIAVPHAGFDQNAYYDRSTKSVQFYYCGTPTDRVYTCRSYEIVAHETGHAILDGIRPLYNEIGSAESAAFHEFVADLSQLLSTMRNNIIRHEIGAVAGGKELSSVDFLVKLGEQFAKSVYSTRDSIRDLRETVRMDQMEKDASPHRRSQVLTNALFKILEQREKHYRQVRGKTPREALWDAIYRLIQIALQPLDLLPPVDVSFADYAAALLRRDMLLEPIDKYGYRDKMRKVLEGRGVDCPTDEQLNDAVESLSWKLRDLNFFSFATSRVAIYRFLHQYRTALGIPPVEDLIVLEPYIASKCSRDASNLPRELVIQYLWREPVALEGKSFGPLKDQTVSLLCGGTLVVDENENLLYASLKPGTQQGDEPKGEGERRRDQLKSHLMALAAQDAVTFADESQPTRLHIGAQVIARKSAQGLRLDTAPRLHPE